METRGGANTVDESEKVMSDVPLGCVWIVGIKDQECVSYSRECYEGKRDKYLTKKKRRD